MITEGFELAVTPVVLQTLEGERIEEKSSTSPYRVSA